MCIYIIIFIKFILFIRFYKDKKVTHFFFLMLRSLASLNQDLIGSAIFCSVASGKQIRTAPKK